MGKLNGKVAIITGGNSGMGLSMAQEFSRQGAKVAILGRDPETLSQAKASLVGDSLTFQGDVRSNENLEAFCRQTQEHFGHIDIVVANAGGATIEPFLEVSEESFDFQADINFKGTFFTIQKALPFMNEGGAIIMVSSSANCRAVPGMSVYGSAKAAIRALARTLAQELAEQNIRINVLTPGPVMTPAYSRTGLSEEAIAEFQSSQAKQIPLKRIGRPEEMASVALFLASDDSSFITGAELVADGGMTQI